MTLNNENGFGLVEGIMTVVIVALLGAVVYFYIQANQKNDQANSASSATATATPKVSVAPKESLESDSVKTAVNNFYSKYWTAVKNSDAKGREAAVAQYGTASYISYYNNFMNDSGPPAGDPVACAQNTPSKDSAVTNISLMSDRAEVTVTQYFASPTTVAVGVVNENGPKINSIACSV